MSRTEGDITQLLQEWSEGSEEALAKLTPLVYSELHQLARSRLQRERADHTLQTTELVDEVYLKLLDQKRIRWQSRTQFFAIAATLMRRILVDYVRSRTARKRPPSNLRLPLCEFIPAPGSGIDILLLNEALTRLETFDPRQARIVEMRFFVGLSEEEIAKALGISVATVKREWRSARAWLRRELNST